MLLCIPATAPPARAETFDGLAFAGPSIAGDAVVRGQERPKAQLSLNGGAFTDPLNCKASYVTTALEGDTVAIGANTRRPCSGVWIVKLAGAARRPRAARSRARCVVAHRGHGRRADRVHLQAPLLIRPSAAGRPAGPLPAAP